MFRRRAKNARRRRLCLGSFYLAVALALFYPITTTIVPALHKMMDVRGGALPATQWQQFSLALSQWVLAHRRFTVVALVVAGLCGIVLRVKLRPARLAVWLLAAALFLLDLGLALGGYLDAIYQAVDQAQRGVVYSHPPPPCGP